MKLQIYQSKSNKRWYWRARSRNGQIVATGGQGYASERGCLNGLYAASEIMLHGQIKSGDKEIVRDYGE